MNKTHARYIYLWLEVKDQRDKQNSVQNIFTVNVWLTGKVCITYDVI